MSLVGDMVDSVGMFRLAATFPEQVADAASAAQEALAEVEPFDAATVVVAGMGGSGITGDLVVAATAPLMSVPVVVCKSYECPAFVAPDTLVFAISASGNTEETLQVATDALDAGARVVFVTGGGHLGALASSSGSTLLSVPSEIPQPRAALGAMLAPVLVTLERLGLYRGGGSWIELAVEQLARRRDEIESAGDSSLPAEVARKIGRTIPLIHGGGLVGAAAAQRWKTQVNENAKTPAWWSAQPELCHNEICGWGQNGDVTRQVVTAITLRHDGEHPQIGRRIRLVADIMREVVADVIEVSAEGEGDLAQLLDLILVGDYMSLWLAATTGVDPGPVPVLGELKESLAGIA